MPYIDDSFSQVTANSMDNLCMLKLLHEQGYTVKKMGLWALYSPQEMVGGMDIFIHAIEMIFGAAEYVEEACEEDVYPVERVRIMNTNLKLLFKHFSETWLLQQFSAFLKIEVESVFYCEVLLKFIDGDMIIEFHETPHRYNEFLEKYLKLSRLIDKLVLLALPLERMGEKRDDTF